MYGSIVGDGAVMGGWLARAQTLLGGDTASGEAGWVSLNIGMWEGDRTQREARFREALDVGRRVGDDDLEFVALAYLGATLVHDDCIERGMALLDEALAAVAGSEVDDFCALQEIFCQLFAACEHAHDVSRADQWIRVGEAIASRRQLPAVSAFSRCFQGTLTGEVEPPDRCRHIERTRSPSTHRWTRASCRRGRRQSAGWFRRQAKWPWHRRGRARRASRSQDELLREVVDQPFEEHRVVHRSHGRPATGQQRAAHPRIEWEHGGTADGLGLQTRQITV
jgi:hypothetical protein